MLKIQKALRETGDPEKAAHALRFFKTGPGEYGEGDQFLGLRVPDIRRLAKEGRDTSREDVLTLLQSPYHEERLLALLIWVDQFRRGEPARRKEIYMQYLDHAHRVNGWDLVDTSAPQIVGGWLVDKSRRPLYRLAKSQNLWERRIAIMATFHFIRLKDFEDALKLSGELLLDDQDLMHKAVGWMLREVGNRDRAAEEKFLKNRYHKMPRTMLRYAIEKFPEPLRQDYLKGRV